MTQILRKSSSVADSRSPYLDSDQFAPASVVLACLADDLPLLAALDGTHREQLAELLKGAIRGDFDRIAFSLALKISGQRDQGSVGGEISRAILNARHVAPFLEPDLCFWLAREAMARNGRDPKRFFTDELSHFKTLIRLEKRWIEQSGENTARVAERTVLKRLGLDDTLWMADCWRLMCWQWALASQLDIFGTQPAIEVFGTLWRPRHIAKDFTPIIVPPSREAPEGTRLLLAANNAAKAQNFNVLLKPRTANQGARLIPRFQTLLFSPRPPREVSWLRDSADNRASEAIWLNLLAGSLIASTLLQAWAELQPSSDEFGVNAEIASLGDMIAEAFLILRLVEAELTTMYRSQKQNRIDALARYVFEHLDRLGQGHYGDVSDAFALSGQQNTPAARVHWHEAAFFKRNTAEGGIDDTRSNLVEAIGSLRTLRRLEASREPQPIQRDAVDKARLLWQFILNDAERQYSNPDEILAGELISSRASGYGDILMKAPQAGLEATDNIPKLNDESHLTILMLDPAEVERIFVSAANGVDVVINPFRARFCISLSAFWASLHSSVSNEQIPTLARLVENLAASASPDVIDPYVSERLLEILNATITRLNDFAGLTNHLPELWESACLAMLEYARPYHLDRLVSLIFSPEPGQAKQDLQLLLFSSLLRLIRNVEIRLSERPSKDPWRNADVLERLNVLRRTARMILSNSTTKQLDHRPSGAGDILRSYSEWIAQEFTNRIHNLRLAPIASTDDGARFHDRFQPMLLDYGTIVSRAKGEVFALTTDQPIWPDGTVNFSATESVLGYVNLFNGRDLNALRGHDGIVELLGVIVQYTSPDAGRQAAHVLVNVGLPFALPAPAFREWKAGNACIIAVSIDATGIPSASKEPAPFKPTLRCSQLFECRVDQMRREDGTHSIRVGPQRAGFAVSDFDALDAARPAIHLSDWLPDIAWCYSRESEWRGESWICYAEVTDDGKVNSLRPIDRPFEALFADEFADREVVALTFVGASVDRTAWRFCSRPGWIYRVSNDDFGNPDRDLIAARLTLPNQGGLRVRVHWDARRGGLRLGDPGNADEPERAFDDRNLRWQSLFGHEEQIVALPVDDRSWVISDLPENGRLDGFPEKLAIRSWNGRRPSGDTTSVVVQPDWNAWHQRTSRVDATLLTQELRLPSDSKRVWKLLNKLARLKTGDRLTLEGSLGGGHQFFKPELTVYRCLADGGLLVSVNPETITLMPWFRDQAPRIKGREVVVTNLGRVQAAHVHIPIELGTTLGKIAAADEVRGVLTALPGRNARLDECTVHWLGIDACTAQSVDIPNIPNRKLGAVITAKRVGETWTCSILPNIVYCSALWRYVPTKDAAAGHDVGTLTRAPAGFPLSRLAEITPGTFTTQEAAAGGAAPLGSGQKAYIRNESKAADRVTIETAEGLLCGEAPRASAYAVGAEVWSKSIKLVLVNVEHGLFVIQRRFDIAEAVTVKPTETQPDVSREQLIREQLIALVADGKPVPVRPNANGRSVRVDAADLLDVGLIRPNRNLRTWFRSIAFGRDEGPFFQPAHFMTERAPGRVMLAFAGNEIIASARQVPACEYETFKNQLGLVENVACRPAEILYYAGTRDLRSEDGEVVRMHVFEWALGWRIELTEDQIRWHEMPFNSLGLTLLYGDEVTSVSVVPANVEGGWILKIEAFQQTALCDLHELSDQAGKKILTVIEVSWQAKRLRIRRLLGLNRTGSSDHVSPFAGLRPIFTPGGDELLKTILSDRDDQDFSVLGRLDREALMSTRGSSVSFDVVNPTANPKKANHIEKGEIVFLWPQDVEARRNDQVLELCYPMGEESQIFPLLEVPGEPNDLKSVRILRRQFSARQDRLAALAPTLLRMRTLLIPVAILDGDERRTRGALIIGDEPQIMERRPIILANAVRGPFPIHAIVVRHEETAITLELKPAVFVTLDSTKFIVAGLKPSTSLEKGTIVLVELAAEDNVEFRLTVSSVGHKAFIAEGPERLAVGLPTNPMFAPWRPGERIDWATAKVSVGDLPDVTASADPSVNPQDIRAWMQQPHPKLILAKRVGDRVVFRPWSEPASLSPTLVAGLTFAMETDVMPAVTPIQHTPNAEPAVHSPHRPIDAPSWLRLTFADMPAAQIAERARAAAWRYHDGVSTMWPADREGEKAPFGLPDQTSATGPLTFVTDTLGPRLRYNPDEIVSFGLPTDALIADLVRAGVPKSYVIAYGRQPESSGSENPGSLWVELSPGRIAELPPALCVWVMDIGAITLQTFAWDKLASGDVIELSLFRENDPMAPDRIRLVSWSPGLRGAFPQRLIAPIIRPQADPDAGSVVLGAEGWHLTLPMMTVPDTDVFVLNRENLLRPFDNEQLRTGDTVLLELGENGSVLLAGFPDWKAEASPKAFWPGINRQLFGDRRQLAELLRLLGGSVPVHVREWRPLERLCLFERGHRIDSLADQSLLLGRVIGWHGGLKKVLIGIGSGLHTIEVQDLVWGAPEAFGFAIVEALVKADEPIWLRWEDRKPIFGYRTPLHADMDVAAIATAGGSTDVAFGIVCRIVGAGRLAWIDANNAMLANGVARADFEKCLVRFKKEGRELRLSAHWTDSGELTAVDSRRINQVLRNLQLGSEIKFRLVADTGERDVRLAWLDGVKAIVKCRFASGLAFGQSYFGEVSLVKRGRNPVIEIVPPGKRRIAFDLPVDAINAGRVLLQLSELDLTDGGALGAVQDLMQLSDPVAPPESMLELRACLQEIVNSADRKDVQTGRLIMAAVQAALRSYHLEALSRLWLYSADRWFEQPFWHRRANQILRNTFRDGGAGVRPQLLERIGYLLGSMEMREPTGALDVRPTNSLVVAAALAASVGMLPRPQTWYRLVRSNKHLTGLVESARKFPVRADDPGSISAQYVATALDEFRRQLAEVEFERVPLLKGIRLSD
jgi:hypothetical protein